MFGEQLSNEIENESDIVSYMTTGLIDQPNEHTLLRQAEEKYKSFTSPDYSFMKEVIAQRPYDPLLAALEKSYIITEITDVNEDVSFVYELKKDGVHLVLQLSMLGPYAVLLTPGGAIPRASEVPADIRKILQENNVDVLSQALLEWPVDIVLSHVSHNNTTLFQALFSTIEILPWRQS